MADEIKILCVDDERNVLKALRRVFMDEDYEFFSAESGAEGLGVLEEEPDIQVVISDYRMPGMDGVDFLRRVRERWPETVRIVLSGFADTASVVAAINEGQIYRFIPKPWNDEELKEIIAKALDTFFLRRRNEELTEQLRHSNEELQSLNENLELLVAKRTGELEFQNQVLQRSQFILDVLPVGVMGIDDSGMIVLCNQEVVHLLQSDHSSPPVGMEASDELPAEVLEFIAHLRASGKGGREIVHRGTALRLKGAALKGSAGNEGVVLVVDRAP